MKKLFENEPENKRPELIEANAYLQDKTVIKRPYSQAELQQFKDDYCLIMERFSTIEDELKDLASGDRDRIINLEVQKFIDAGVPVIEY